VANDGACPEGIAFYREAIVRGHAPRQGAPGCLLTLGLLRPAADHPERLYPSAPSIALAELSRPIDEEIDRQRHRREELRAAMAPLDATYTEARAAHGATPITITGKAAISAALEDAVAQCRTELISVQPDGGRPEEALAESARRVLPRIRQGLRNRSLYQHVVRTHAPTLAFIRQVTEAGGEARTLSDLSDRMIICDRTVAFIPSAAGRRDELLAIQHTGVIDFLIGVFERAWIRATPLANASGQQSGPEIASDLQLAIMRLLVAGCTDATIANRLGVSTRTVTEHVRRISKHLGSRSRAQLGYLIATGGVLERG
jgi:DNA-binding NarL/FixJ family response regulator